MIMLSITVAGGIRKRCAASAALKMRTCALANSLLNWM